MHVLWIQDRARHFGGAEGYISRTVTELRDRGVENSLLFASGHPADEDFIARFDRAECIASLREQVERIKPEVIYIHQLESTGLVNEIVETGVPAVRFYHDHRLFCLRRHKITFPDRKTCTRKLGPNCYWRCMLGARKTETPPGIGISRLDPLLLEQAANRQLDAHVVGSAYMAKHLQMHDFDSEKIWVMPLYAHVPARQLPVLLESDTLLFVGALTRGKGLDTLLRALSRIAHPWRLNVIGNGPQEAEFRRLAGSLKIDSRVNFVDLQPGTSFDDYYAEARFLVLPSRAPETFALVGPEAFSFGKPVIASDIGGTGEWLEPGENGLAVPPDEPAALSEAIELLLRDKRLCDTYGRNARKTFEQKFTPRSHVDKLLQLFDRLADSSQEHPPVSDSNWGRFTAAGGDAVERDITGLVHEISRSFRNILDRERIGYTALVMIGGYGRGEGGVVTRNGKQFPHNNFDFVLILDESGDRTLRVVDEEIRPLLARFQSRTGVGMDLSTITARKLKRASNLVIWYDMRFGHKTLLGDAAFVPGLRRFRREKIPASDIRNLLVNRGTLFLINQLILEKTVLDEQDRKTIVRHAVKGIIGYGDALLYYHDLYHWSYREKQRRMRTLDSVDKHFRRVYDEAMNFRFRPDYEAHSQADLSEWMQTLLGTLSEVHLACERFRLDQPNLDWDSYVSMALRRGFVQEFVSPKGFARQLKNLLKGPALVTGFSLDALACRLGGYREMLSIFFPVVAYDSGDEYCREFVAAWLGAASTGSAELRAAYLRCWGVHGDTNFRQVLEKLALPLEIAHP